MSQESAIDRPRRRNQGNGVHLRLIFVVLAQIAILEFSKFAHGQTAVSPRDSSPVANDQIADNLSETLAGIVKRHELPGMAAVVMRDSRIVASGVAGVRRRGDMAPITINNRFHIGSQTKPMTATLCAKLVKVGKLKWDTTLAQVFPELRETMLPPYRGITLAQLLTHRSGIRETIDADDWKELVAFEGTPTAARRRWLERVVLQELKAETGSQFIYSNTNYILAGHIMETVIDRRYEELIRDELFMPLGMTSAGFGAPGIADELDEPRGHTAAGEIVEPSMRADNPQVFAPSGTVHCSLPDWVKFTNLQATLGESQPQFLPRSAFDILHRPMASAEEPKLREVAPTSDGYAMGWFVFPNRVLAHTGTNLSWFANCAVIPHAKLSVVVACNQGGDKAEPACHEALQSLVSEYYPRAKAIDSRPNARESR
jgi:CubicO group peptidase (beta-lactamase class C family)